MAAVLAPNYSHTNSASSHMPKMSTSRRGMDGGLSKRVVLFCNGDKFFKGKKVFIVPSRYHNFSDFLNDLTGKLPSVSSLPYGVRQIFSPTSGRKIRDIDEVSDGRGYVCAGFEQFRPLNYGEFINEAPRVSRVQAAPRASANVRHRLHHGRASHDDEAPKAQVVKDPAAQSLSRDIRSPKDGKSKLFVVISNAIRPRKIIRIFLSAHTVPTMERLMNELHHQFALAISNEGGDASAAAEFTSGKIRRLYSLHGVEVTSPADFFKADDQYIALGSEKFTTADLKEIINELYPNGSWPKNIFKSWESQRSRKRKPNETGAGGVVPVNSNNQKSQPAVPATKRATIKDSESEEIIESSNKMPKTGRSSENVASNNTSLTVQPPPPVVASMAAVDSRSRIEGERMKKDSGFVDFGDVSKTSESPNHHPQTTTGHSVVLTSADHQASPRGVAPEAAPAVNELPTVFEVRSVESQSAVATSVPSASVSAVPEKSVAQNVPQQQEKILKPVHLPTARKPMVVQQLPDQSSTQPPPGSVVESNAPKSTWEVDPELANLLDQQQGAGATTNVQKYAVLPEIGYAAKPVVDEAPSKQSGDEEPPSSVQENNNQVERLPAEPPVLEPVAVASETLPPPVPPAVSKQPVVATSQSPPQTTTTDDKRSENQQPATEQQQQQQPPRKLSLQGGTRPKLEHAPLLIDGKPESRPTSRSSTAAPNSAPGRVVNGKLSRQLSKIDHVTTRFEYVGKQLGDGNFAVVRRCRRRKTGSEYAMKIIDKAKLKGKFHMVENEIRIMRVCDHPNLVKLFEMYETDKEIYLVMELVPDGDLFDAITAAVKFDEPTAARMVQDMASGLFYLHSRRIVHRDLKPENLLVLRSSLNNHITLKLGDFGLAMEVTEPIYSVCGTPTYVAPEILSEKGYGLEVDLWALGVISYILMCGFPPFRSQKRRQSELFEQIKSGKFVFLAPYWDPISVLAKELISKLLVVDARRRYTAPDVLCHPWVISQGGSTHPQGDMAAYRKTLRKTLEEQSRANWKQWVSTRQKNGFTAILAGTGPAANIVRPSSRN